MLAEALENRSDFDAHRETLPNLWAIARSRRESFGVVEIVDERLEDATGRSGMVLVPVAQAPSTLGELRLPHLRRLGIFAGNIHESFRIHVR
jgi:hypothetical protein